jgi:hypothetical protein
VDVVRDLQLDRSDRREPHAYENRDEERCFGQASLAVSEKGAT